MPAFQDAFSVLKNDRQLTQEELIRAMRLMIAAEYEAVQLYTQLAESIDNEMAIKVLNDIADEEKVHAGEFLKVLKTLAPDEEGFYQEGEKEVENLKFSSANEALQHLADLTGKSIRIASSNELVKIFMERDEMTQQEANEYVKELRKELPMEKIQKKFYMMKV